MLTTDVHTRVARRVATSTDGRAAATTHSRVESPTRAAASQVRVALGVVKPDHSSEVQADRTAARVMAMPESAASEQEKEKPAAADEEKPQAAPAEEPKKEEKPAAAEEPKKEEKPAAAAEEPKKEEKPAAAAEEPKKEEKPAAAEEQPAASPDGGGETTATSTEFTAGVRAARGGGSPLSDSARAFMEPRFGANFSNVRVHTSPEAHGLSQSIGAKAFTVGSDIFFSNNRYQPDSKEGQHLLAHELTHVVQNRGSRASVKPGLM
jgi:flagellar biosynthesis GTPase FlhF